MGLVSCEEIEVYFGKLISECEAEMEELRAHVERYNDLQSKIRTLRFTLDTYHRANRSLTACSNDPPKSMQTIMAMDLLSVPRTVPGLLNELSGTGFQVSRASISQWLSRQTKKGYIVRLRRGLYQKARPRRGEGEKKEEPMSELSDEDK